MFIQSHDGLEIALYTVTGIGTVVAFIFNLVRGNIEDKIVENKKMIETQWSKIDELRTKSESFITRDRHDQSIKDIYEAIEKAVETATKPLIESLNRLADKVDKLMDKLVDKK